MTDNEMKKLTVSQCPSSQWCRGYNSAVDDANDTIRILNLEKENLILKSNFLQAEIERSKATVDSFTDIGKLYSEIKVEAVKEFAERFKTKLYKYRGFIKIWDTIVGIIDNLVKEMVGED